MIECSDNESSDNETEPLAVRIARQSRTTKAKVKYTLSDDDDNDDDNDDDIDDNNNDGSENEWMEIKSSDSEDELSIIKRVQKQPSKNKKGVKFATSTKDQDKMDTEESQTTGVVKDAVVEKEADNLELPAITKPPLTDSKPSTKPPTDSKPPSEKPKKKATTTKKQDKASKKTTQTTLFDTGVKVKAGAKRKTATDAEEEASKKSAKQPPKPKVNTEYITQFYSSFLGSDPNIKVV